MTTIAIKVPSDLFIQRIMGNGIENHIKNISMHYTLRPDNAGIQKKVYEVKTSRKKARELVRKNIAFFSSMSFLSMIKTSNHHHLTPSSSYKLPSNAEQDLATYTSVKDSLSGDYGLHGLHTWQYFSSTVGEMRFPPVDQLPRTWKESLRATEQTGFCLTPKQMKYQELIYEVILTEQSYVDDLILINKIFIDDLMQWDGLPVCVRSLFENVFHIIRVHLQLLKDLRKRQLQQHPVVTSISDIYRSHISKFGPYSAFFSNYEKASYIITESMKNHDELGVFINRRTLWHECRNLPFTAYLLTPIQRVMKYPLFFKSLEECLLPKDKKVLEIQLFLQEMDILLRFYEKQKKNSEDHIKLEDLASRIKGLEGSIVHIAEPGRRLIYEGYLDVVPTAKNVTASSETRESSISFPSSGNQTPLRKRSSAFSLSNKKTERFYVFLFNDMIIFTRERSRKKASAIDGKWVGLPQRRSSCYGSSPDKLFKISSAPGRVTMVDRCVLKDPSLTHIGSFKRGSGLFQSIRRQSYPAQGEALQAPTTPLFIQTSTEAKQENRSYPQENPLQFACSIATRNLTNIIFEAQTPEEKNAWCHHIESVLSEHVQRGTKVNDTDVMASPCPSSFSFESSTSYSETLSLSATWNGYFEAEKMDIDQVDTSLSDYMPEKMESLNQKQDDEVIVKILDEFGDSIWDMNGCNPLSPTQLKHAFSGIGKY